MQSSKCVYRMLCNDRISLFKLMSWHWRDDRDQKNNTRHTQTVSSTTSTLESEETSVEFNMNKTYVTCTPSSSHHEYVALSFTLQHFMCVLSCAYNGGLWECLLVYICLMRAVYMWLWIPSIRTDLCPTVSRIQFYFVIQKTSHTLRVFKLFISNKFTPNVKQCLVTHVNKPARNE